ncbi:hypothetical protein MRX96_032581 [Rhipicephalus microplus]
MYPPTAAATPYQAPSYPYGNDGVYYNQPESSEQSTTFLAIPLVAFGRAPQPPNLRPGGGTDSGPSDPEKPSPATDNGITALFPAKLHRYHRRRFTRQSLDSAWAGL